MVRSASQEQMLHSEECVAFWWCDLVFITCKVQGPQEEGSDVIQKLIVIQMQQKPKPRLLESSVARWALLDIPVET